VQTEGEPEKRTVLEGGAVNLSMVRSVQPGTAGGGHRGSEGRVYSDSLRDT
tara:strand:- start:95 stop:247 length:153 start_codon:yes stop_codon:yes gene_type:complete